MRPESLNLFSNTGGLGNRFAKLTQRLEVSRDRPPNVSFRFIQGPPGANATRQIGNVGGPVRLCLLEDDGVFSVHYFASDLPASGMDFTGPSWARYCGVTWR
jgi:hypothetical protein